jgi:membrane-bound lytic murein transglycosylase D
MSRRLLPVTLTLVLTACATAPSQKTHHPVVTTPIAPDGSRLLPPSETATPTQTDIWQQLRSRFAMADCAADPAITAWARTYTRNPAQFEKQLSAVLPRLTYVQQVADQYDVAGEFVLLPWIESHFQPVPGRRRNQPAGMWQIMPATAGAMGLRVDDSYDGRLDVPAATHAVMKQLQRYHRRFNDWRLADYAFNAGEFAVRKLVKKHGAPAELPAIPELPVHRGTREHLSKLLAIACVVREPARFGVTLPTLPPERQLVKVPVDQSLSVTEAASHAGMSVDRFKHLNAAFRSDTIDTRAASYLILPAKHVRQFRTALVDETSSATADADHGQGTSLSTGSAGGSGPSATALASPRHHTVRPGDSLWRIARHYSVSVDELQRWNHLRGQSIKPGLVLKVGSTH